VPAWKSVEAVLGLRLEHPNVVRTFKHSTVLVQVRRASARILLHSLHHFFVD
jgi:hypothetical protein